MVRAEDDADGFEQHPLALDTCRAHPVPGHDGDRRRLQRFVILDRQLPQALCEPAEAELLHGSTELALEQGHHLVDGGELLDVAEPGERQQPVGEDLLHESGDVVVNRVLGHRDLGLTEGAVPDGAERGVEQVAHPRRLGVGAGVDRLPGPPALQLPGAGDLADGGVAMRHEGSEALRLGQLAHAAHREEAAAGGEDIKVQQGLERSIHGVRFPSRNGETRRRAPSTSQPTIHPSAPPHPSPHSPRQGVIRSRPRTCQSKSRVRLLWSGG